VALSLLLECYCFEGHSFLALESFGDQDRVLEEEGLAVLVEVAFAIGDPVDEKDHEGGRLKEDIFGLGSDDLGLDQAESTEGVVKSGIWYFFHFSKAFWKQPSWESRLMMLNSAFLFNFP
jgi:hypothetical protein